MLEAIITILAGLLLLSGFFSGVSGLNKVVGALKPFETIIGVVALVIGILNLLSLEGLALIAAGLVLSISALQGIPRIGDALAKAGRWLASFQAIIGVIVLILGIASLF